MKKKLPLGIQTFREIREGGYYYVDKTQFALRLVEHGKYFFLSRPRRFGKSLFLDMLAELFEGKKELFEGLYAGERWDWGKKYPVVRISFGGGVLKGRGELVERIREILKDQSDVHGVQCENRSVGGWLEELIKKTKEKAGQRVVVLVDEYDKPILDNIEDGEVAVEMREELKGLYSVIKGADANLKFAMLTGVSKFSKVSLFSGLNNLTDITLDERYSAICGYTEVDVREVFAEELEGREGRGSFDMGRVREWYNGYNWLGESVYNPYDLLNLFDSGKFRAWWYETGTPTFLLKVLRERAVYLPKLGRLVASSQLLSTFDVGNMPVEALMFQAGYLTIAEEVTQGERSFYRLRYPNLEVSLSLNESLLTDWVDRSLSPMAVSSEIYRLLVEWDMEGMGELLKGFFASVPYQWVAKNPLANYEGYYASVFYAFFASLGLEIAVEESSNAGRLDMAVKMGGRVALFEFKVVDGEAEGAAMRQIKERGYAEKYRGQGSEVWLVGVEFSRSKRGIVGWEVAQEASMKR